MKPIALQPSDRLQAWVEPIVRECAERIARRIPGAEIHHIGATAIPGAWTKGDVDLLVRVEQADFPEAVSRLRDEFEVRQAENWSEGFASFGDDSRFGLPLGVQLSAKGSGDDYLLFLHQHLATDPAALAEYNRLKREAAPLGPIGYWEAKNRFLSGLVVKWRETRGPGAGSRLTQSGPQTG